MYVYHNTENDSILNIKHIYAREQLIQKLKHRFSTYGYREISTSVFEKYKLYATMNGTVNQQEMIKTIDNTGEVLVLRPDVTIPLTKQLAQKQPKLHKDLRYFYILDVYRQKNSTKDYEQFMQAGVEYFGNGSYEADGEIIALAAHVLKELNVGNFTIELGHAGFFKQLISEIRICKEDFAELRRFIQGKNIPELERLLERLALPEQTKKIINNLPLLYGKLDDVIAKTKELPLSEALHDKLDDISAIYDVLKSYDVAEHIVIDLSLINHMDYYSDIIFQGFIERIGKTVLMGGRYDTLSHHFGAEFPAIGFAFDMDLLLAGCSLQKDFVIPPIDIVIFYDKKEEKRAISLAQQLRERAYHVLTYVKTDETGHIPDATAVVTISDGSLSYRDSTREATVQTEDELIQRIENIWEEA